MEGGEKASQGQREKQGEGREGRDPGGGREREKLNRNENEPGNSVRIALTPCIAELSRKD